ncbi:MAG: hypothetical protein KAU28_00190, partial [Phycisphaerae bacterium]|nr:hypothetical protein [Phycisphaerae bacterium]
WGVSLIVSGVIALRFSIMGVIQVDLFGPGKPFGWLGPYFDWRKVAMVALFGAGLILIGILVFL